MLHRVRKIDGRPGRWRKTLDGLVAKLPPAGGTFALCGEFSTGKTQLAVELIRRACSAQLRSRYITAQRLFASARDAMGRHDESGWFRQQQSWPVLVIDELSDTAESSYEGRMLRELIDLRYGFGPSRMTLMVSNAKAEALEASLGQKIVRRIAESGGVIDCSWGPIDPREVAGA